MSNSMSINQRFLDVSKNKFNKTDWKNLHFLEANVCHLGILSRNMESEAFFTYNYILDYNRVQNIKIETSDRKVF